MDNIKETFGLRGSSRSESNHSSVQNILTQNLEGMYSAMQQLMNRQHKLMLQNNEIIFRNESNSAVTCYIKKISKTHFFMKLQTFYVLNTTSSF